MNYVNSNTTDQSLINTSTMCQGTPSVSEHPADTRVDAGNLKAPSLAELSDSDEIGIVTAAPSEPEPFATTPPVLAPTCPDLCHGAPIDETSPSSLKKSALELASNGLFVFPCIPKSKIPACPNGFLDATTDRVQIEQWWISQPTANIGIACAKSGLVVIDNDPRHGGNETLAALECEIGAPPRTVETKTGGADGGRHLFFRAPTRSKFLGQLGRGVDLRHNGYVVAAPSVHPSGGVYRWENSPFDTVFAELPAAWLARMTKDKAATMDKAVTGPDLMIGGGNHGESRYGRAAVEAELANVRNAPEGERNATLNKAAFSLGQLYGGGKIKDVCDELVGAAREAGLPEHEAKRTAQSGWTTGQTQPRQICRKSTPKANDPVTVSTSSHAEWQEPLPLPDGRVSVPQLDPTMLPDELRPWLVDAAERIQCPLEFVTVPATIALGALVGRTVAIRPKRVDDWPVVCNLFGGLVGTPSAKKSPAITEGLRPLRKLASDAAEEFKKATQVSKAIAAVREIEKAVAKENIKKRLKSGDKAEDIAADLASATNSDSPKERRYIVNDSTVEKLGELMIDNPRGLLHVRDELTGWFSNLDRDGHEGDRSFFLEAWNGNNSFTVDRIGRGTRHIPALCLSMVGGIQPGPLEQYLRPALVGGLCDDGLIQRFQLLVYPDQPSGFRLVDRFPDEVAYRRALEVFRRLDGLTPGTVGARVEGESLPYLRFADDAQDLFNQWYCDLMTRNGGGKNHPAIEAHLAKYPSLMPSLALIFHLADAKCFPCGPVTLASAQRSVGWCTFLEAHARRIYASVTLGDLCTARSLLDKLRSGKLSSPFTLRDVYRRQWTGLDTREAASAAIAVLDDHGWVRENPVSTSGRPRREYFLHPSAMPQKEPQDLLSVLSVSESENSAQACHSRAAHLEEEHIILGEMKDITKHEDGEQPEGLASLVQATDETDTSHPVAPMFSNPDEEASKGREVDQAEADQAEAAGEDLDLTNAARTPVSDVAPKTQEEIDGEWLSWAGQVRAPGTMANVVVNN